MIDGKTGEGAGIRILAFLVQSCWSQTRQAVSGGGCNAWVWCGLPAGCNNGYGTIYPYGQCTLKFQASLQALQASLNESSKFGASNFTSGWIREWHPPLQLYSKLYLYLSLVSAYLFDLFWISPQC
jgi:hypothetical protein